MDSIQCEEFGFFGWTSVECADSKSADSQGPKITTIFCLAMVISSLKIMKKEKTRRFLFLNIGFISNSLRNRNLGDLVGSIAIVLNNDFLRMILKCDSGIS